MLPLASGKLIPKLGLHILLQLKDLHFPTEDLAQA
jgi:hypothetical protein